ncbi:MAG: hypothetical protein BWX99_01681 [Deltaproteobacteria bacterium ADurb.Bin151]|nr:MAG: hypothetical protein BWX99_01681 [Deltaproteobacteria bacterium ADurb.Bin151]
MLFVRFAYSHAKHYILLININVAKSLNRIFYIISFLSGVQIIMVKLDYAYFQRVTIYDAAHLSGALQAYGLHNSIINFKTLMT